MRRTFRFTAMAAAAMVLMVATTESALADNAVADGDDATPVAANGLSLGTVCINSSTHEQALVAVSRNGSATGTNTFANSAQLTVSVQSASGSGLSAAMDTTSIGLPSSWTTLTNNTMSDPVSSTVNFVAGSSPGSFSGTVVYAVSGRNTSGTAISRTGQLAVSATVSDTGACAPAAPDTTPPTVTVSFPAPVSGQNGWFSASDVVPVVGTVTASDASNVTDISCTGAALSGVTGYGTSTASGTLTVSGDGAHDVACTATDGASNMGDAAGSANTATVKVDTTPPSFSASLDPSSPAASGWYNIATGAPTVAFTCSDDTSGLAGDCPTSYTFGEGTDQAYGQTIYDNAGNAATAGVDGVEVDLTAPTTVFDHQSPAANGSGWNNTDVTLYWDCADDLSGPVDTAVSTTVTGEGAGLSGTGTCYDAAGNSSDDTEQVNIDETPPTVSVTGVTEGASYVLGDVPTAGCSTTDSLSGVATPATVSVTGGTSNGTGTFTATCAGGTDLAGNAAPPVAVSYTVDYHFSGFLAPVNNPATVNTGKAGRTYPVKWQLTDASGNYINALSAVQGISYKQTSCSAYTNDSTDALESTVTGGTSLRYDSTANQYVYNWATPSKGCYTIFVTFDSGQVADAYFNLS
ncbi:MAG TPA: PxKF domain-containing protein [Nocardioidaceae bacterium]|nr:PxKF domain-containing protein [Nocardioidaceae bacterium]